MAQTTLFHTLTRPLFTTVEMPRFMAELCTITPALPWLLAQHRTSDGQPVLMTPGMGPAIGTVQMRTALKLMGHKVHTLPELTNMVNTPTAIREVVLAHTIELSDGYGEPITLVGWSYGGAFTRMVAHEVPNRVRQVVNLGSMKEGWPYPSDYKYTGTMPLPVPTTNVYSHLDGFFTPSQVCDPDGPQSESISIPSSHLGMGNHALSAHIIADRLAQPKDGWRPFQWNLSSTRGQS